MPVLNQTTVKVTVDQKRLFLACTILLIHLCKYLGTHVSAFMRAEMTLMEASHLTPHHTLMCRVQFYYQKEPQTRLWVLSKDTINGVIYVSPDPVMGFRWCDRLKVW